MDPAKRPPWEDILRVLSALEADARLPVSREKSSAQSSALFSAMTSTPALPMPTSNNQLPVIVSPKVAPMSIADPNQYYPFAASAAFGAPLRESGSVNMPPSTLEVASKLLIGDSKDPFSALTQLSQRKRAGTDYAMPFDLSMSAFLGKVPTDVLSTLLTPIEPSVSASEFRNVVIQSSPVWSKPFAALPLAVFLDLLCTLTVHLCA